MNVTRIAASGFRSWRDLDVEPELGVTAITGANGAGKSSILAAVDVALYGGPMRDLLREGATTCLVAVEFDHHGEHYRVERSYSSRGAGKATLDLAVWTTDIFGVSEWSPVTGATIRDTQARIDWLLGMTRETWRASAYLAQRDGSFADPSVRPGERKALLRDALGLELWDDLRDAAWHDASEAERDEAGLRGELDALVDRLGELGQATAVAEAAARRVEEAGAALVQIEADAQRAHDALVEANRLHAIRAGAVSALNGARSRLQAATDHVARLWDERRQLAAHQVELDEAAGDMTAAAEAADELEAARRVIAEREARNARVEAEWKAERAAFEAAFVVQSRLRIASIEAAKAADDAINVVNDLNGEQPTCDACGQPLDAAALDHRRRTANAAWVAACDARDQLKRDYAAATDVKLAPVAELALDRPDAGLDLAGLERRAARALGAAARAARLRGVLERAGDLDAAIVIAERTVKDATSEADEARSVADEAHDGEVDAARRAVEAARIAVADARQRHVDAERALAVAGELVAEARRLDTRRDVLEIAVSTTATRKAALEACVEAFGANGIPAMILETSAIPQIEGEANRVLGELGTSYRVELVTQRAKRAGDGIIDTLDVVVHGPAGARAYDLFSGGEQTRINLALRLGLARLLAQRHGSQCRLLMIDEPDGLDTAGMERLAGVLRSVESSFDRVLVVSHHPDLRDAFDRVVTVERSGDASRIVSVA